MLVLLQLSIRNLWRQRRRNSVLLIAIVIAIAGVLNMNALTRGMLIGAISTAVENFTGHVKIQTSGYVLEPNLTAAFEFETLNLDSVVPADIEGAAMRVVLPAVIMSERETRGVQLFGIDSDAEHISSYGDFRIEGRGLESTDDLGLIMGKALVDELRTGLNKRVVVISQDANEMSVEIGFRIVGFFEGNSSEIEESMVFTGLTALQRKLDTTSVTEYSIRLKELEKADAVAMALRDENPQMTIHTWRTIDPFARTMYEFAGAAIYVLTVVIMGSLVFGLINTFVTAVMERVREFGLLRAIGMQKRQVLLQVQIESTVLMVIGICLGLLLGFAIYLPLSDGIDLSAVAAGMEYTGLTPQITPVISNVDVYVIVFLSIFLGFLASLYPARRAMGLSPLDATKR